MNLQGNGPNVLQPNQIRGLIQLGARRARVGEVDHQKVLFDALKRGVCNCASIQFGDSLGKYLEKVD